MRSSNAGRLRPAWVVVVIVGLASGFGAGYVVGQEPGAAPAGALRVFFECHTGGCDFRQFRTEIDWVNWVRDRKDAQLHVIVTSEETGSGGRVYRLDFIGLEDLADRADQLTYTSLGTDVRDETVQGLQEVLAVGLARYAMLAGAGQGLRVARTGPRPELDRLVTSDEVDDPWDFWVFEVNVNGGLSGETSREDRNIRGGIEARRTTTTWKLALEADGSWRESEIVLSDSSTLVDTRRNWSVQGEAVYALAEHWSVGGESEASASTRTNQDFVVSVAAAGEYSFWPYEQAPRRSLRVRYRLEAVHFNYEQITLFERTEETRGRQEVEVSLFQRQPWGSSFANVEASHYLHDLSRYRVSMGGRFSFRIARGLDLRVNGRASWIRDQIFLPLEGATDEEILLQRRRLASDFDWNVGIGFGFQFGSIFNNVVNNRF